MHCLDERTLDDFVSGRLAGDELSRAERHLDQCVSCTEIVHVLAAGDDDASPEIRAGERIGRYVVQEPLGSGAMGVVLLARDPELDRDVALKLLRPDAPAEEREHLAQRMEREARALARVSHPHVVKIYDVGRHDDRVYLALEYVPGTTLRNWLGQSEREDTDVLRAFMQAGEGLAATHAAGLVHRDFKPANVLVDATGRARITDFGLASHGEERAVSDDADVAVTELTRTGVVVGTPAYMAPEVLAGGEATSQSDQFSFCVALFEALHGARPFAGKTRRQLLASMRGGARVPKTSPLSRRARAALERGLSFDPAQRFADVTALLSELAPPPRKTLGVFLGLAAAVAAGALAFGLGRRAPDPCASGDTLAAPVWNSARSARVGAAFGAVDGARGPALHQVVDAALGDYLDRWRGAHRAVCEATEVRREQSPQLLDARMHCLRRRLNAADAVAAQLERANPGILDNATTAVNDLPSLDACNDVERLTAEEPRPKDEKKLAALVQLERELDELSGTKTLMAPLALRKATARTAMEAQSVGFRPAIAEARLLEAFALRNAGEFDKARDAARAALFVADASKHDAARARAWLELVAIDGAAGDFARLKQDAEHAGAALARIDDPPVLVAAAKHLLGSAELETGDLAGAERSLTRALKLREQALGRDHPDVARSLTAIGNLRRAQGRYAEALELHRRALQLDERRLGADHDAVARHHHNLGGVLRKLGKNDEARKHYEQALAASTARKDAHAAAMTRNSLGLVALDLRDPKSAEAHFRAAHEALHALNHPDRALTLNNLGVLEASRGRHAAAIEHFDAAHAIFVTTFGPKHWRVASALKGRARAELAAKQNARARATIALARAALPEGPSSEAGEVAAELAAMESELRGPAASGKPRRPAPVSGSGAYGAAQSWDSQ